MKRTVRTLVRAVVASGAIVLASACATATPYQPLAQGREAGGYTDTRLDENRYLVSFTGNDLTSRERVESYLLFRAAELTLDRGYDWFRVVDHELHHDTEREITPSPWYDPWYYGRFGGWQPYWRYRVPGGAWGGWYPFYDYPFTDDFDMRTIERFEARAEIVLGKGPPPPDAAKWFDARKVKAELGPRVEYPS